MQAFARKEAVMRLRRVVPVALLMLLCTGAVASADDRGRHHGHGDFAPMHRLGGLSGGELEGQWWARIIEIPNAENPLGAGTESLCLTLAHHGSIVAPVETSEPRTCTVGTRQHVFISTTAADCSSNEPDPYHGDTEAEQRACAIEQATTSLVVAVELSLDGGRSVDIHRARFFEVSPQMSAVFDLADPAFDAEPGRTTFVAAGYAATVSHRLRPGPHVVTVRVTLSEGDPVTLTIPLNVIRQRDRS
jgi:hypothetical protein